MLVAADSGTDQPLGYIVGWVIAGELQVNLCHVTCLTLHTGYDPYTATVQGGCTCFVLKDFLPYQLVRPTHVGCVLIPVIARKDNSNSNMPRLCRFWSWQCILHTRARASGAPCWARCCSSAGDAQRSMRAIETSLKL